MKSSKTNDLLLGLMTFILLGTTAAAAYYGYQFSQMKSAKIAAESQLINIEGSESESDELIQKLRNQTMELQTSLDEQRKLNQDQAVSSKNYLEQLNQDLTAKNGEIKIARKNVEDIQKRLKNSDQVTKDLFSALAVEDFDLALKRIQSLKEIEANAGSEIALNKAPAGKSADDRAVQNSVMRTPRNVNEDEIVLKKEELQFLKDSIQDLSKELNLANSILIAKGIKVDAYKINDPIVTDTDLVSRQVTSKKSAIENRQKPAVEPVVQPQTEPMLSAPAPAEDPQIAPSAMKRDALKASVRQVQRPILRTVNSSMPSNDKANDFRYRRR